ncbi:MAG: aquaporin [Elusimicrobia bacterium]|nr:aquaporin [Elusimicrobiota bacterium]
MKSYLAEIIGTFALVFVGAGSVCMDAATGGKVGLTGIALAHGLAITAMSYAYAPISGAHFNPAVTAAMLINRRMDAVKGVFYVICQLLGASLAGLLLASSLQAYPHVANTSPFLGSMGLVGIGFKGGTLLEAVMTFFLVSVIYATSVDCRGFSGTAPLAAGLAVSLGTLAIGPLTGAALNPARAFGPAVATGRWENWFVYWIGPLAGAAAASLLHENFFLESTPGTKP